MCFPTTIIATGAGRIAGREIQSVAASLHQPETAYLSYSRLMLNGQSCFGVARIDDRGQSWRRVWKESEKSAENIHRLRHGRLIA